MTDPPSGTPTAGATPTGGAGRLPSRRRRKPRNPDGTMPLIEHIYELRKRLLIALAAIVVGALAGFALGTWFAVGMVGFAGAAILYDTQQVYRHYPRGAEIAAAAELFSSIALLFWYVLQLVSRR